MDPTYYSGNYFFDFFINFLNVESNNELVLYFSFFFILTCIVSGFFRLFFQYLITRFVYFFGKNITSLCYQKIIFQEYKNLFSKNTNDSLSIFQKMPIVNNSVYNTLLMAYNFTTFIFIFLVLSYINLKITISATLFFLAIYLFVIFIFKKRMFLNATNVSNEQATNLKIVRETFNGYRDILINNYQNFYNTIFLKSYSKLLRGVEENRFFFVAPRPIIETFLLSSIGIIIIFNAGNYSSLEKLLPIIAVLAVASQRILPILNQLYVGHMSNVDATPAIRFIHDFINKPTTPINKKKINPIEFKNSISIKNVSFSYASNGTLVLKDININITAGSRIGIIGKSGSGKSTLADLILGLLDPTKGKILVDGTLISKKKHSWFLNVASVPQNIFITDQTIAENIAFGKEKNKIKLAKVKEAAEKAQIKEFIEDKDDKYFSLIGEKGFTMSTGQRQRLAIARALYKKSKLIIFDEATSSLDSESEKNVLNTIFSLSRKRHTSIIITHKLSNLKRCDHIYKIQNSKIIKFK
tara:strand:- start:2980 stop:4557 length:1578 start_codon:yes stop_codon:yes gene_type:complete